MTRISAAQRRTELVQAAVEVIVQHGMDGATTRRIADHAGTNLAMVHYCFASKEALLAAVYDYLSATFRALAESVPPQATLEETARQILRSTMEYYLESPLFAITAIELTSWARRQQVDSGIVVFDHAIEQTLCSLRSAVGHRVVDDEVIVDLASVIASVTDGFAVGWVTYADRALAERQMRLSQGLLDLWLAAHLR